MKKILIIFAILLISANSYAERLLPDEVVKLFIQSIQQNDLQNVIKTADFLRIEAHPRHSMNPKQLVNLFKDIDLDSIEFEEIEIESWLKFMTVRMIEPFSYDFELELRMQGQEKREGSYVIIWIHPSVIKSSVSQDTIQSLR